MNLHQGLCSPVTNRCLMGRHLDKPFLLRCSVLEHSLLEQVLSPVHPRNNAKLSQVVDSTDQFACLFFTFFLLFGVCLGKQNYTCSFTCSHAICWLRNLERNVWTYGLGLVMIPFNSLSLVLFRQVFHASLKLLKMIVTQYIPKHKLGKQETAHCVERTLPNLLARTGDSSARIRIAAANFIQVSCSADPVFWIQLGENSCIRPQEGN